MNKIPPNFSELTQVAVNAALASGNLLEKGFGTDYQISKKIRKHDVVTEFDHAAEKLIVDYIRQYFPSHSFLAEESGLDSTDSDNGDNVLWVIDPLDGTINFARNVPIFTVSIGVYVDQVAQAGVIYQPMTHELFVAERGRGSYLNGNQIHVSKTSQLETALLSTSLSFDFHKSPSSSIEFFSSMAKLGNPMRSLGSSALNLAYVAAGRFDIYWNMGRLHPWDMGAGVLLIDEAGGKVTESNGLPCNPLVKSTILATNGRLHLEMLTKINGIQ